MLTKLTAKFKKLIARGWLGVLRKVRFISKSKYEMEIVALDTLRSDTCWTDEPEQCGFVIDPISVLSRLSVNATLPKVEKRIYTADGGGKIVYNNGDTIVIAGPVRVPQAV